MVFAPSNTNRNMHPAYENEPVGRVARMSAMEGHKKTWEVMLPVAVHVHMETPLTPRSMEILLNLEEAEYHLLRGNGMGHCRVTQ